MKRMQAALPLGFTCCNDEMAVLTKEQIVMFQANRRTTLKLLGGASESSEEDLLAD